MRLADLQHEREALQLRLGGASYRSIADQQGCSTSTAFERVERALAAHVPREEVEAGRKIAHERLDAAIGRTLEILTDPGAEPATVLAAAATLVRLTDRVAKLDGLDRPVEQTVTIRNVDETQARIDELVGLLDQRAREQETAEQDAGW